MSWIETPNPMPGNPINEPTEVWGMISSGGTPRRNLTVDWEGNRQPTLWEITRYDETLENLKKVVPGDIMYYWNGANYHVVIIDRINSSDNDISLDEIELIEATWSNDSDEGKVFNSRSIDDYEDYNWIIGRLITN